MRNSAMVRDDGRIIRRLASALCTTYNIPQGDNLVVVLGDGDESNNQVAVESWVRDALLSLDETSAREMLPHLVRRFRDELAPWEVLTWP